MRLAEGLPESAKSLIVSLLLHTALLGLPAASLLRGDPLPPAREGWAPPAYTLVEVVSAAPAVDAATAARPVALAAVPEAQPVRQPENSPPRREDRPLPEAPPEVPADLAEQDTALGDRPSPLAGKPSVAETAEAVPVVPPSPGSGETTPSPASPAPPGAPILLASTAPTAPPVAAPGFAAAPGERPAAPAPTSPPPVQPPSSPPSRTLARLVRQTPPQYPMAARREGQSGTVHLRLEVGEDGRVHRVELAASSGFPLLDAAAVAAAKTWQYEPARENGHPVTEWRRVAVVFRLEEDGH